MGSITEIEDKEEYCGKVEKINLEIEQTDEKYRVSALMGLWEEVYVFYGTVLKFDDCYRLYNLFYNSY